MNPTDPKEEVERIVMAFVTDNYTIWEKSQWNKLITILETSLTETRRAAVEECAKEIEAMDSLDLSPPERREIATRLRRLNK